MWWMIVLGFILLLFIYLLFAPFYMEINTVMKMYRIRFHRICIAGLIFKEDSVFLELKVVGWQKQYNLLAKQEQEKKPIIKTAKKQKKKRAVPFKKIRAVLRSFKVRKLILALDTGDMELNGMLYPLFVLFRMKSGRNISINFKDENKLILQIENNFARMIWAFIKP